MEFRTYAAREATAVVARLVETVSEKSLNDLQSLRHAIEMVAGAVDTVLEAQEAPEYREEVHALAERLAMEAEGLRQAATDEARREAEAVITGLRETVAARTAENAELTATLDHARAELDRLRAEIDAQNLELESRSAALAARAAEAQAASTERDDLAARLEANVEQVAAVVAERNALTAQLQATSEELAGFAQERGDLAARLEAESNAAVSLRRRLETLERELTEFRIDANVTRMLRDRLETADRDNARLQAQLAAAAEAGVPAAPPAHTTESDADAAEQIRRDASAFLSTSLDRVASMYAALTSGTTIDAVLASIVEAVAVQFPRVALFRVQGKHLEGVRQAGFDLREDISQLLIPRSLDGLITNAVTSGRIETRSAEELADTIEAPFGGSPAFALALPLVIDGQPLAVVYADDAGPAATPFAAGDVRVKYAQLLQCQAIPVLATLSAEAAALTELDEYSALLLEQLEQTYQSDTGNQAPGAEAERRERLRENIDYARQLYAQRAAAQGARAAMFFEQRLLGAIDAMRGTVFGRDLAALAGVEVAATSAGKAVNGDRS